MSVDESIRERDAVATALNDELHELHSSLSASVTEFEALLDETLDSLPEWVEADREAIRDLFHVEVDGQRVTMGPRAAALVASRVEIFVRGCTSTTKTYDDEAAAKWVEQVAELDELIAAIVEGGRDASEAASVQLAHTFDELVTDLAEHERPDPKREAEADPDPGDKLDALRQKLRSGKVGAALATRESEADTLELQRRKTEELEDSWLPLTELAAGGADLSQDAADRLKAIVAGAVAIAIRSHDVLAIAFGEEVEPPPLPEPPPEIPTEEMERPKRADGSDALDEPRFRYDTDAPRTAQDTPSAKAHTATATMEVSLSVEEFREPAFRLTTAWRRVDLGEMALALGVPASYFIFITALTIGYHVGVWPENPFSEWSWALPVFFAFALWAVGFPAFMGWQVEWDGRIPRALRMSDKREQSFVDVDEVAVEIADHSFDLARCGANLTRFEAGGDRGWSLILQDSEEEVLFASEATSGRWDDSNSELVLREPQGAWRVSEEALLQIADRCI